MSPPLRPLPDTIGRYKVVRLLGQGAMGRVVLAHDPVLDRDVAVKLLRDDLGLPSEHRQALLDRMRQEARASARVSHPSIVALHDMGDDPELGLFLVFEYVEGVTLKDRLTRGPLGSESTAKIARAVGDALTTAHSAGVLHRDIKPENVILTKTGAKIADFGIARVPDSTLTRDGGLLGTPAYSAPEAIASGKFSPLSDQFSMAATLYEAISLHRAFPGDDAVAVATRIATEEPPRIAEVCGIDAHVDTVLARALSKNPRARFESCEEFGRALADALELTPRAAQPTLPDERHRWPPASAPGGNRLARTVAIGAAGVGALFAIGAVAVWLGKDDEADASLSSSTPLAYDAAPSNELAERPSERKTRRPAGSSSSDETRNRNRRDAGESDARNEGGSRGSQEPAAAADTARDAGTTPPGVGSANPADPPR
jgi:eukaryotic-like serine/threonine-protein kinase